MDYRLEQLRFELREDPSSRIFFKLGEHLRREGELDQAIEVLRTGLKQHSHYVAAWVSLGRAQLDNGDAEGAQEALEKALQLDPENTVAARTMGEAAIVNGDWIGAVKALKRARGLVPRDDILDERIAFVEARLEELGQLEQPPARDEAPATAAKPEVTDLAPEDGEEPFAFKAGDTGTWDSAADVFAAGWVEEEAAAEEEPVEEEAEAEPEPEPFDPYSEPPPLTDDDVSPIVEPEAEVEGAESADSVGDEEDMTAEVAKAPEDGFVAPEPELESEPEVDSEPDTDIESEPEPEIQRENDLESEPEPESDLQAEDEPWPEIEPEPDTAPDTDIEPALEPEPEIEPEMEFEPETDSEPDTEIEPESVPVSVPEIEPESEPDAEPELESEPENDSEPDAELELVPEPESEPDVAPEMDIEPEPEIEPDPEFGEDAQSVPLPTMTLARLAIDQGDLDLAERTLREVLEREPGHADASELLESLLAGPPEEEHPDFPEQKPVDPRAEALRRWLDAVRLASERLKT